MKVSLIENTSFSPMLQQKLNIFKKMFNMQPFPNCRNYSTNSVQLKVSKKKRRNRNLFNIQNWVQTEFRQIQLFFYMLNTITFGKPSKW